jgi:hypothetical protein
LYRCWSRSDIIQALRIKMLIFPLSFIHDGRKCCLFKDCQHRILWALKVICISLMILFFNASTGVEQWRGVEEKGTGFVAISTCTGKSKWCSGGDRWDQLDISCSYITGESQPRCCWYPCVHRSWRGRAGFCKNPKPSCTDYSCIAFFWPWSPSLSRSVSIACTFTWSTASFDPGKGICVSLSHQSSRALIECWTKKP